MRIFGSFFVLVFVALGSTLSAEISVAANWEFHVSVNGDDSANGTVERPLRSLSEAAQRAQAGDLITVHEGVYRESVNPPRGGLSDTERIVYQAAPGRESKSRDPK
jgi:alpha-N-arabinofuranosidase